MKENEIYIEILKIQNDLGMSNKKMSEAIGINRQTYTNKKSLKSVGYFNKIELENLKEYLKDYVKTL